MNKRVTREGLFFLRKCLPLNVIAKRLDESGVITRLLQFNQINDVFWESVAWKQNLLIHTISQQSLMLWLICREKCMRWSKETGGARKRNVHRQRAVTGSWLYHVAQCGYNQKSHKLHLNPAILLNVS